MGTDKTWNKAETGTIDQAEIHLNFESFSMLASVLTPKPLELMKVLRQRGLLSIRALSKQLGRELILGGRQDKQFGPVILVGLGGIFVEIFEQATMRIAPISRKEAFEMIEELDGSQILMGARGEKRFDIEAIVDAILRLSQLLTDFPQIRELDINPLRVFHEGDGCSALDARIIL